MPLLLLLLALQDPLARDIDAAVHEEFLRFPHAVAAPAADDGEFLRRLLLDLLGRPPTEEETTAFAADPAADKRRRKIDALLASDGFAEFWARRFAAAWMREPPRAFVEWLRDGLRRDRPWSEVVADLVGALGKAEERPALAYALSRNPLDAAAPAFVEDVSRHFLGIDIYCARCHDHGFDRWTVDQYYELAAFAVRRTRRGTELVEGAEEDWRWAGGASPGKPARFLYGGGPAAGESPTAALARLVTAANNPQFSKAAVNRVWGWLSDRPLVDPPEEFDLRNRPVSRKLLEVLTKGFDAEGRSLQALIRAICSSATYQRSSAHEAAAKRHDFTRVRARPLSPEQILASAWVATQGAAPIPPDAAPFHRESEELRTWIRTGPVLKGIREGPGALEEKVDRLFLAALSRKPEPELRARVARAVEASGFEEVYRILILSDEFGTRH